MSHVPSLSRAILSHLSLYSLNHWFCVKSIVWYAPNFTYRFSLTLRPLTLMVQADVSYSIFSTERVSVVRTRSDELDPVVDSLVTFLQY